LEELPGSMPVKRRSAGQPGCAGGDAARRRGERARGGGRGGSAGAGGLPAVLAHGRSGRTPGRMWAKKQKQNMSPVSRGGKKAPVIPCVFSHLAPPGGPNGRARGSALEHPGWGRARGNARCPRAQRFVLDQIFCRTPCLLCVLEFQWKSARVYSSTPERPRC
jgi:hypothetical protein